MSFAQAQYRTTTVNTASPVRLLVQLYDGAIRFMSQAIEAHKTGDNATRGERLRRAHAVVTELQVSLIPSHAPELCEELERLYDFVLYAIAEGSMYGRVEKVPGAINVMRELRSAWHELASR